MKNYICIDIGGTNTRVQLRNEHNQVLAKHVFATLKGLPHKVFDKIVNFIKHHQGKYEIIGIGISAPGPTDYKNGVFLDLPNNHGWNNFNFKQYLIAKTGISQIKADNDANLMALAHHFTFKKSDHDITQFFTVSTGFGAGLIMNNNIYTGAHHYAQEIAAVPISWIPEKSSKFGKGALEYFAAGSGIAERARSKYSSPQEVFANYDNDDFAKTIIDDGIDTIANMIATTLAMINPSILVFDGAVARHNKWYIKAAIKKAKANTLSVHFENLAIYFGDKGDDAAIEGAFYLIKGLGSS